MLHFDQIRTDTERCRWARKIAEEIFEDWNSTYNEFVDEDSGVDYVDLARVLSDDPKDVEYVSRRAYTDVEWKYAASAANSIGRMWNLAINPEMSKDHPEYIDLARYMRHLLGRRVAELKAQDIQECMEEELGTDSPPQRRIVNHYHAWNLLFNLDDRGNLMEKGDPRYVDFHAHPPEHPMVMRAVDRFAEDDHAYRAELKAWEEAHPKGLAKQKEIRLALKELEGYKWVT